MRTHLLIISLAVATTLTTLHTLPAAAQQTIAPEVDPALEPFQAAADAYVRAMNNRDKAMLGRIIDYGAMFDRAATHVNFPDLTFQQTVRSQFAQAGADRIGSTWIDSLAADDKFEVIKVRNIDGQPRALCRMAGEGGMNYHDLYFIQDDTGRAMVSDVFVMFSGENVSESSGRAMALAVSEDPQLKAAAQVMEQMFVANDAGQFQQTLDIYEQQPEDIQNQKTILLLRLTAATKVSLDEIVKASNDFTRLFPDNAAVDLHRIDPLITAGEYDAAIEAIRSLQERVEGDPYLDGMVADVYLAAGQLNESREAAIAALEKDRSLIGSVWTLVTIALEKQEWSAVAEHLTTLVHDFGVEFNDLKTVPEYADFAASEEYEEWLDDVIMVWDLTDADKEILEDHRKTAQALFTKYLPDAETKDAATLDQLIAAYLADADPNKPAIHTLVSGVGVALGDLAIENLGAEWVTFTNAYVNNVFALYHTAGGQIELPFHIIANAVEGTPSPDVCKQFLTTFAATIEDAKKADGDGGGGLY